MASGDAPTNPISSPFDHRATNKTFTFNWASGSCILVFASESSSAGISLDAGGLRLATINLAIYDTGEIVDRERSVIEQFELSPPFHEFWHEAIRALALPAGGLIAWPWVQILTLLGSSRRLPPEARAFLRSNILREGHDAAQKALFLDHYTLWIALDIVILTDVPLDEDEQDSNSLDVNLDDGSEVDQLDGDDQTAGNNGLSRAAIDRQVRVWVVDGDEPGGETCTVCLDKIERGSEAGGPPCGHAFHPSCIRDWLEKSKKCPICRFEMQEI